MEDYKRLLPIFKEWFYLQFGMNITCKFDETNGFADENINVLWIGFCGGWIIRASKL